MGSLVGGYDRGKRVEGHPRPLEKEEGVRSELDKVLTFNQKLFRGDCMDILPAIENASIDMILTDPPYGISFKSGKQRGSTREGKKEIRVRESSYFRQIENDATIPLEYLRELYRVLKPGGGVYIFSHWRTIGDLQSQLLIEGFTLKNLIVIAKTNHGMGDLKGSYAPKHELVSFCSKGRHVLDNSQGRISDVLPGVVIYSGRKHLHPNEKPLSWLTPFIERSSHEGDVILDPFMGSGSVGEACKRLGRRFIGVELDPEYFSVAVKRLYGEDER